MRRLTENIAVRSVILALMIVSALGYTTVLHYCTMSQSSECCCTAELQTQRASSSPGASFDGQRESCDLQIVAGGLTPVAMNIYSDIQFKAPVPETGSLDFAVLVSAATSTIPAYAHADDIAPPKVDIYVRDGALLI
jgi:hypothetical protein